MLLFKKHGAKIKLLIFSLSSKNGVFLGRVRAQYDQPSFCNLRPNCNNSPSIPAFHE